MLSNVATVLAGLIGAGCVFIGVLAFLAPQAAAGFGIPGTPTEDRGFRAWLTVKAMRDLGCGLFVFVLIAGATAHLLGWFMLAMTVIPVGDMVIVLRSKGPRATAYGVHGATAAVILVVSVLLLIA
ncbi:DUF4267 domain-containing protein [Streptomyces sp. NPDC001843]|uniref:DUF4267 domain-containing protein n=1 Tax=Streptomyces sp. NPDC001843 TaxID=3364617 RepID=UPI003682D257